MAARTLGSKVKILREAKGLSQGELGRLCGVGRQQVSLVERGGVNPSVPLLTRLAEILEVQVDTLTNGDNVLMPPWALPGLSPEARKWLHDGPDPEYIELARTVAERGLTPGEAEEVIAFVTKFRPK